LPHVCRSREAASARGTSCQRRLEPLRLVGASEGPRVRTSLSAASHTNSIMATRRGCRDNRPRHTGGRRGARNQSRSPRGTGSSNPSPSSRQSVSRPHPLSKVENPRLSARVCAAGLATGSAETRRVFRYRANRRQYLCRAIFQYPVPLMGLARMPRRSQRTRGSGLNVK
jgi:hypothetical protein